MALSNLDSLEPVALTDLKSGDQVAVKRKVQLELFHPSLKVLNSIAGEHYYHHGIFVEPRSIIHQAWPSANVSLTKACKEDIMAFMNAISVDGVVYKVVCNERSSLPADEVVQRAEEVVASGIVEPFNIVTNNCETFATFLKTGERRSSQVQAVCRKVKAAAPEVFAFLSPLLNVQLDSSTPEQELELD